MRLNGENRCILGFKWLFMAKSVQICKFLSFFIIFNQKIPKRVKYLRLISCLENGGMSQPPLPLLLVFSKANHKVVDQKVKFRAKHHKRVHILRLTLCEGCLKLV